MNSKKRRWLLRGVMLTVSTLSSLLVAELALRVIYERPWYERLLEEQEASFFRFNTDSQLRDRRYATPKPPGHVRVLLLGDSFTVGQGVPDREQIFAEIVERRLNDELSADSDVTSIDILNGGLGGSLTRQWVDLYQRVESRFEPDLVVAVFFLRDGTRTSSMGAFFGPIRDEIVARNQSSSLYRNLYLYRFFRDLRDRRLVADRYGEAFQKAYFGNEEETEEWRAAQRNLLRIRDRARTRSADFALVVFPILASLDEADYPFQDVCDAVSAFARENDIPVHDLLPAFRGRNAGELWVSAYDQHPNPAGHAIAADSLLPFLRERLDALDR